MVGTLLLSTAALGLLLLAVGLRGRLLDRHPHCRRCGFDLIGTPGAPACPECGSDLAGPKAIKPYDRRRRAGPLAAGLVILAIVLTLSAGLVWSIASGVNLNPYKPVWLLLSEAGSGRVATADAAAAELIARQGAGELSAAQRDELLRRALARHADLRRSWPPTLTSVIYQAMWESRLTPEEMRGFLERLADPTVFVEGPRPFWAGESVELWIDPSFRAGNIPAPGPVPLKLLDGVIVEIQIELSASEGVVYDPEASWEVPTSAPTTGTRLGTITPAAAGVRMLRGEVVLTPKWDQMAAAAQQAALNADLTPYTGVTEVRWPFELAVPVELSGSGLPGSFSDTSVASALSSSVSTAQVTVFSGGPRPSVRVALFGDAAPADLSMDMFLRAGDREWPFTGFADPKGAAFGIQSGGTADGFDPDAGLPISIVLRTNPDRAARKRDQLQTIWSGEVEIKEIEVVDQRPRARSPEPRGQE
ncbi:MAG: hypothetical protein IT431_11975 [Phycisphaerales bacterium]|nr:hypothetical protein [Phycisphaerales bacterium]